MPRLIGLSRSYALRRRRELTQQAVVINLANHEPKKLEKAIEQLTAIPGEDTPRDEPSGPPMAVKGQPSTDDFALAEWSYKRSWENEQGD